ncbi:hypothetical protein [Leifsonia sp. NCR5]|uniref:hypothetical protein n=1 Tax=Leifsonia sp. NCR5 TaxID=1978342 RepID=UPI000A18B3EF|nr:hypothetical protein [Leifsonia sp. NCR5]
MPDAATPNTRGLESIFDLDGSHALPRTELWTIYSTAKPRGLSKRGFYDDLRSRGFREVRRDGVFHFYGFRGPAVHTIQPDSPDLRDPATDRLVGLIAAARAEADQVAGGESAGENDARFRARVAEILRGFAAC